VFGVTLNSLFGFERNHYDRMLHFLFGLLLAYPIREVFVRIVNVKGFWSYYLPWDVTISFSVIFEFFEWGAATVFGGDLGVAYLGTQGDVWDAHKDMLLATIGGLITMCVVAFINWKFNRRFADEIAESLSVKQKTPLGEHRIRNWFRRKKKDSAPL
jgi:putative membrane protein